MGSTSLGHVELMSQTARLAAPVPDTVSDRSQPRSEYLVFSYQPSWPNNGDVVVSSPKARLLKSQDQIRLPRSVGALNVTRPNRAGFRKQVGVG